MSRCFHDWPGTHPNLRLVHDSSDAAVRENRDRHDEAVLDEPAPTVRIAPLRRPSVIPLDGSLLGRLSRWLRSFFLNLRSPL